MGCKNQPSPQRDQPRTTQAAELHLLQHAQKLHLRKQAQISNLIQKQRPVARLLKVAFARPVSSCIRALFMSE